MLGGAGCPDLPTAIGRPEFAASNGWMSETAASSEAGNRDATQEQTISASRPAAQAEAHEPQGKGQPVIDLAPVREAMAAVGKMPTIRAEEVAGQGGQDAPGKVDPALPSQKPALPASATSRIGVLLVNLGTPDAPKAKAVRAYLREFLSDPRVIEKNSLTWRLVFNGIILPFRPRIKARAYRKIWNREHDESPLKTITRSQAEQLAPMLAKVDERITVDWAMRYGNPSIESRMRALIAQGCDRILVVPLYPQYSSSTTATVADESFRALMRVRNQPALRIAAPYYDEPAYIEAIASSIKDAIETSGVTPETIIASYHGMPLEYVEKGDPYLSHCTRTTELLRERLGLGEADLMMTFQSRFGRDKWLEPFTDRTLRKLAKDGLKNVAVVTPGFSADCLETLEEIAIENAHLFKKSGGKSFLAVPCLNDSARGLAVINDVVMRELKGWI
jgi:protoporphyrin/coproporphyrin ferrochelatase